MDMVINHPFDYYIACERHHRLMKWGLCFTNQLEFLKDATNDRDGRRHLKDGTQELLTQNAGPGVAE